MGAFWRFRRLWRQGRPLGRRLRRAPQPGGRPTGRRRRVVVRPWAVTLLAGLLVAALLIGFLEARLRPMVVTAAQAQTQNAITRVVEHAIQEQGVDYADLVTIQRDSTGAITALTTNTAALNQLRAELVGVVLEALEGVDVSQIQIPLGSLLDFDLLWGLGPSMLVHAMTVGTVEGDFSSDFSAAGVNQTIHRIALELTVPLTLMLPGGAVETVCETQIPIAETVIVGQVPQVFFQNGA